MPIHLCYASTEGTLDASMGSCVSSGDFAQKESNHTVDSDECYGFRLAGDRCSSSTPPLTRHSSPCSTDTVLSEDGYSVKTPPQDWTGSDVAIGYAYQPTHMDAMDMVSKHMEQGLSIHSPMLTANSSSLLMGSDSSTAKEFTSHVKTPYFIPSPSSQIYDDIIQGDQSALSGYLFPSFEDDKPYCPSGVPYGWIQDDIRMEETYTVDEDSIDTALFLSELEDFMQEIEYEDLRSSLVHDIPDECK